MSLKAVVELTEEGTYRWEKTKTEDGETYYQTQDGVVTITFRTGVADALRFDAPGEPLMKVYSEGEGPGVKALLSQLKGAIESQQPQLATVS
jgi:hypothetical protein